MSRILVVDDENNIRSPLYDVLSKMGHEVMTVPRGDQVLDMSASCKPDLIILNVQVPGEEGLSLLRRLPNQKENRVATAIYSGCVTQELEKEAYSLGAVDVIPKGIDLSQFRMRVNKILEARERKKHLDTPNPKGEKILVVDDEENIRTLLKKFLSNKGYDVLTAANGEEAVKMVQDERPSMVLLDITMPGMDGILTLKKIREIDRHVGVVMATSVQDAGVAREAVRLGAYAYVLKPFDFQYLEMAVLTRLLMA